MQNNIERNNVKSMYDVYEAARQWMCELKSTLTLAQRVIFNNFWIKTGGDPYFILETKDLPRYYIDLDSVIWWNKRIFEDERSRWFIEKPDEEFTDAYFFGIPRRNRYLRDLKLDSFWYYNNRGEIVIGPTNFDQGQDDFLDNYSEMMNGMISIAAKYFGLFSNYNGGG